MPLIVCGKAGGHPDAALGEQSPVADEDVAPPTSASMPRPGV